MSIPNLKTIGLSLLIVSSAMAIVKLQQTRLKILQNPDQLTKKEIEYQLKKEASSLEIGQHIPSFGYKNLKADWFFLQFLQYFGDDDIRRESNYLLSPEYFKIVVNEDPWFSDAYNYLATSISLYAGQPQTTVELMNQGLSKMKPTMPKYSFYLWRIKAIDELLFVNPHLSIQSYLTAAKWADFYTDPMSIYAAKLSRLTAAFLIRNPDSRLARVNAWSQIIVRAVDDKTRSRAIAEIEKLGGKVEFKGDAVKVTVPKKD